MELGYLKNKMQKQSCFILGEKQHSDLKAGLEITDWIYIAALTLTSSNNLPELLNIPESPCSNMRNWTKGQAKFTLGFCEM